MRDRRREQGEEFKKLKQERCREKEELKFHGEKKTCREKWTWTLPVFHHRGWVAGRILRGMVRVTGFPSHDEKVRIRT